MEEKIFLEESVEPTEQLLEKALGKVYLHYQKIIALAKSFSMDWVFSKKGGWMEKIHDNKKALFYIIPLKDEIKISMAIRERKKYFYFR
jgi:hypothetical protein